MAVLGASVAVAVAVAVDVSVGPTVTVGNSVLVGSGVLLGARVLLGVAVKVLDDATGVPDESQARAAKNRIASAILKPHVCFISRPGRRKPTIPP